MRCIPFLADDFPAIGPLLCCSEGSCLIEPSYFFWAELGDRPVCF